jgi:hypothetical protein
MIKSRRMSSAGHVRYMEVTRNTYKILVKKPERRRKLVTPRHRWQESNTVKVTVLMFLS